MTLIYVFGLGVGAAVLLSLVTVVALRAHLANLLEEMCGSHARAGFWTTACVLWIVLLGLLAGTVSLGYGDGKILAAQDLFFGLVTQVRACLIGLLGSLMIVAWVLLGFIRRFERGMPSTPPLIQNPFPRDEPIL
jgi:hypothetical protein